MVKADKKLVLNVWLSVVVSRCCKNFLSFRRLWTWQIFSDAGCWILDLL